MSTRPRRLHIAILTAFTLIALFANGMPLQAVRAAQATDAASPPNLPSNLPVTSTVKIIAATATNNDDLKTWTAIQSGSGFVIDANQKYILTNAHVVLEEGTETTFDRYLICTIATAQAASQCNFLGDVMFADVDNDLALVKVSGNVPGLASPQTFNQPAIDLSQARLPDVAEKLTVIGFPPLGGNTITLTQGIASGFINDDAGKPVFIKTDSQLIHGTSGGMVTDDQGRLVGIPTMVDTGQDNEEIGLLIAGTFVKEWFASLQLSKYDGTTWIHVVNPTKVTGLKAEKSTANSIQLTWKESISNEGIQNYEIASDTSSLSLDNESKLHLVKTPNATTTYTFNNLDPSKTYYFAVRGVNKNGDKGQYWSDMVAVNLADQTKIYKDLPVNYQNAYAIAYLKDNQIMNGYPDGTFRPNRTITRAELAKIVVLGKDISPDANQYRQCFPDVKDEWFAPYVCYAKAKGWISGYADQTFKPGQTVNLAESLKIIENIYELPAKNVLASSQIAANYQNQWFSSYLNLAAQFQIIPSTNLANLDPAATVSRALTAEQLYRTILIAPLVKDYAANSWKDQEGKLIDPVQWLGLKNGATMNFKVVSGDNTASNTEEDGFDQKCSNPTSNCFRYTSTDEKNQISDQEYIVQGNEILLSREDLPLSFTKNPTVLYDEKSIVLSNHNIIRYSRPKNPVDMMVDNITIKLYDGVQSITSQGIKKIDTVLGTKDALEIETQTQTRAEVIRNGISVPVTIIDHSTVDLVEGIGVVKKVDSAELLDQNDETHDLYHTSYDLSDYKSP